MRTRSPESRERARAYWRRNGAARARAYAAAARRDGICTLCRKRPPIAGFDNCQECTQRRRTNENARTATIKRLVMQKYGGRCATPGCEASEDRLTIDHVDGRGKEHRELHGLGRYSVRMYRWLIRNDFPDGFQVLCVSCNASKGRRAAVDSAAAPATEMKGQLTLFGGL